MSSPGCFPHIIHPIKRVCQFLKKVVMNIDKLFNRILQKSGHQTEDKRRDAAAPRSPFERKEKQRDSGARLRDKRYPFQVEVRTQPQSRPVQSFGTPRPENSAESRRNSVLSDVFASSGPLATTAVLLATLRAGGVSAAESMHRQLQGRMKDLHEGHEDLDALMNGTEYAQLLHALEAISQQDFTMEGSESLEAFAQEQIDLGLDGLSAQTRRELLNTADFAALRPAAQSTEPCQEPEQSE